MQNRASVGLLLLLAGCGAPEPNVKPNNAEEFRLALEPATVEGLAARVVRIRIQSVRGSAPLPAALSVFEGSLSEAQLRYVKKGELPATLAERKLPIVTWQDTDDTTFIAPSQVLVPEQTYALVSRTHGSIGSFVIDESDALPVLQRVWPPVSVAGSATYVVFCGAAQLQVETARITFEPGNVAAELKPGVDADGHFADRCVHITTETKRDSGTFVPPTLAGNALLDPSPITLGPVAPVEPLDCTSAEQKFGPGCATILDDRVVIRSANTELFWILEGGSETLAEAVPAQGTLIVRGLMPGTTQSLGGSAVSIGGERFSITSNVEMQRASSHLVLNEVLADPLGPEPVQEWIELYNDGQRVESLANYVLEDGSGKLDLPAEQVAPGEYALLVSKAFDPNSATDVAVASGTKLVRLPKLGNGLSNAGESLRLVTRDGHVVSEFPAAPKPKAGISIARRHPWDSGANPAFFGLHATPGASPGSVNQLD